MYLCSFVAVVLSMVVMVYVIAGIALTLRELGIEHETLYEYRRRIGVAIAVLFNFFVWPIFQKPVWWFFSYPQKDEFI